MYIYIYIYIYICIYIYIYIYIYICTPNVRTLARLEFCPHSSQAAATSNLEPPRNGAS